MLLHKERELLFHHIEELKAGYKIFWWQKAIKLQSDEYCCSHFFCLPICFSIQAISTLTT